ncbi:photosystem II assembly protein Psb34 [Pseudanabaena sp. PCC 6802]|uniref:photosystem II assembly protein Psb34 n=1 Tax=Pseudanabaena sp. PCC 6802 TaxID=118173 RepID=UPI000344A618|nr:ssl1498 family light-harvesting-like protein [Pseudanabaena sp. PCC 6802]
MRTLKQEKKNELLRPGYTVDEEGTFNVYAIEPTMYLEEPITPQAQRRYMSFMIGGILLLLVTILTAFSFAIG